MADVTYRIIIEGMGGKGDAPKTTAATPSGDEISPHPTGGGTTTETGGFAHSYTYMMAMKNSAAVGIALKYANTAITTAINRVELRTGRATYQEQLNYQKSATIRGLGIAASIIGGLATGNYLLAVGGVSAAVDWGINTTLAKDTLNLERAVNNVSIGMANVRAGAGGDRYGRSNY